MTTHTQAFRVRDSIALPGPDVPLAGHAERSDDYPVHVTRGLEETLDQLMPLAECGTVAVLLDETVESLYGLPMLDGLRARGRLVVARALPPGEPSKSLDCAVDLWHWLATTDIGRRDLVVTFGGGVINDLGGWVASVYMRGVPYVNVPTTLIAQVDGAIGGKVAANHPSAKNLLGAFAQPQAVICDVGLLRSLPSRHLSAGLAECVKKAIIASPAYWDFLAARAEELLRGDQSTLHELVRAAVAIKTELIARDPYELDLRRPLNFGHTIGHPLETVTGYTSLLHGEAVAVGMVVDTRVAHARGLADERLLEDLIGLLGRLRLPVDAASLPGAAPSLEAVLAATGKVRLIRGGSLRFVLPVELGVTEIADDVTDDEIRAALSECGFR